MNTNNEHRVSSFIRKLAVTLCIVSICGCAGGAVKKEEGITIIGNETAQSLLSEIIAVNSNSPQAYTARLSAEGSAGKKKFNVTGEIVYNKTPRMMRVTLLDAIFRSVLTVLIQDNDALKLYFPMEKSLYLDSASTISIQDYATVALDFKILYPLAVGQIPLIENYSIKRGLAANSPKHNGDCTNFLILENDFYFETISFSDGIPDKILLLKKNGGIKTELYLEKPLRQGNALVYRKIRLILPSSGERMQFTLSGIQFDQAVDPGKVFFLELARGVKIINMK